MNTISHRQPTFEDFWTDYPRKIAKRVAAKSWDREMKAGTAPDEIVEGLRRQLPYFASRDPQFIPHASTWLNQGRWSDEVQMPQKTEKRRSITDAARDLIGNSNNDHWFRSVQH